MYIFGIKQSSWIIAMAMIFSIVSIIHTAHAAIPEVLTTVDRASPNNLSTSFALEKDVDTVKFNTGSLRIGTPPLQQFGYSLFQQAPTSFAPVDDIPIPNEYIVGPGDEIHILLFGTENFEFSLIVTREGVVNFPRIGPIAVSGLTFKELKELLNARISAQIIGVKANITLGSLRSIRVFVLGDVNHPGSYTVSSLSTLTNALFASGGIKPIGTLRNIEVKRHRKVAVSFDLYDLLLRGDTSKDIRLLPGDVIFVKPVGKTVGIGGEVRRPAIYELHPQENTVHDLLTYAGGMLPTAFPRISQIERIGEHGRRTLVELDLSNKSAFLKPVTDGDTVHIFSVLDRMNDIITVSGHVRRPGGTKWQPGLRLQDVLKTMDELKSGADTDYALIRREQAPNSKISVLRVNLQEAINHPFGPANILLSPRDQLMVFANNKDRTPTIKGLIDELKMQAQFNQPAHFVSIAGNVRLPGDYPYQTHMRISDLLRAALNFQPATDMQYALIKRHHQAQNHIEVLSFALQDALNHKGTDADLKLQPGDEMTIFKLTQERRSLIANIVTSLKDQARYDQPEPVVTIKGNVKYPGAYPLAANMKVSDLVRASLDLLPDTDMQYALLRRESPGREGVTLLPLSLDKAMHSNSKTLNPRLQPRDQLIVLSLTDQRNELIGEYITELRRQARQHQPEPIVTIQGNVRYPGDYPLAANMRAGDLVRAALDLLPETDRQYALLQRLSEDDITTIIPIALHKILSNRNHKTNIMLRPRDKLLVFTKNTNRRIAIDNLIDDLNRQARLGQPALVVKINGMVEEQGAYPLTTGMRVSDIILAAGGLEEAAYTMTAEITRYVIGQDSQLNASHQTINLGLAMAGDLSQNLLLEPHDTVTIKQAPDWSEEKYITISGEVRFPGVYPITKGETLSQVVMRAGGIADLGDMQAAVFSRQSLRDREDEKKQQLIEEMERDIAILEQSANYPVEAAEPYDNKTSSALLSMQYAVSQVKQSGSIGRLVINLPGILAKQEKDIILKHGDMLYIPQQIQEIAVVGEVMNPSSVLYTPTITLEEYIQASGGLTSKADQSRIYVVKSNGAVVTTKPATTKLFSHHSGQVVVEAGDVIMVPMDLEHVSDLAKWTDISQITYRFALAAEALNTLGIF